MEGCQPWASLEVETAYQDEVAGLGIAHRAGQAADRMEGEEMVDLAVLGIVNTSAYIRHKVHIRGNARPPGGGSGNPGAPPNVPGGGIPARPGIA